MSAHPRTCRRRRSASRRPLSPPGCPDPFHPPCWEAPPMKRVVLLWLVGSALGAQATPTPALLALSKTDLTLAIVSPATNAVIARLPSGPDPHEVVASSDGRF